MHIKIKVNKTSVLFNTVGDFHSLCVLDLRVLTVFVINRRTCGTAVPNGFASVKAVLRCLSVSVFISPFYDNVAMASAEVNVPLLNDFFKNAVGSVLVYLIENVTETYVMTCGNNVVFVVRSAGENVFVGEEVAVFEFSSYLLCGKFKSRGDSLCVIFVVKHRNGVSTLYHTCYDFNVGGSSYSFCSAVYYVKDYGSSVIPGNSHTLCRIVINGYLVGDTYVTVIGKRLSRALNIAFKACLDIHRGVLLFFGIFGCKCCYRRYWEQRYKRAHQQKKSKKTCF